MHIPDGFLSTNTWASTWVLSAGGISFLLKKISKTLKEKTIPLIAISSAFVFAAQMINFPVLGGTSGHLLGGILLSVLLGPYVGALALSVVLIVQCLIFQDGGLTALGANILNMCFIGTFLGYFIYSFINKLIKGNKGILIGAGIASFLSVLMAAVFCSLEIAFSNILNIKIILPAMISVHIFIGIGEALITIFILSFILKVRPDLIYKKDNN